jgi:hypothetical protein
MRGVCLEVINYRLLLNIALIILLLKLLMEEMKAQELIVGYVQQVIYQT